MKSKRIKILTVAAVLFACCFALSACDPSRYHLKVEDFVDVVDIELINYDNPTQKHFFSWVPNHTDDLKPFDASKMTHLENLEPSKTSDFIAALCECEILGKYYAYDSPKGICIKVNFSNGDFLILCGAYEKHNSCRYVGEFSADGAVKNFIGCFNGYCFQDLVNDYFETQI
ncbi:MAG: hypothetical protein K2M95_04535 [Clostridiales bacterium]|nr:hypothetical protein [Clostridiales bacterium]